MIASGEKKEEYREIKSFYTRRFTDNPPKIYVIGIGWTPYTIHKDADDFRNFSNRGTNEKVHYMKRMLDNIIEYADWKPFDTVTFRNGYAKDAPQITLKLESISIGPAKPEWSDNWQGNVFIIKLGEILS